ncbi:hypothetical protein TCAL_14407 [Tigriopus californicus]|uniref:J domain-containing protein n=1 Tax=Tigriopus californicus TaxID=6832 RepID=A0A553PK83_TIGCA|nr:hypothetical protein TCAL_14407 [Tigriopus californicus]
MDLANVRTYEGPGGQTDPDHYLEPDPPPRTRTGSMGSMGSAGSPDHPAIEHHCVMTWMPVVSKWNSTPTHYEVLGLSREATPKEIKDAYLNLSKAEARNRARNTHFMAINEAYSILSKPKDRHIYDLGLYREHPVGSQPHQASGPYRTMYREPMSFDERAELFGFKTPDPNFYRSSRMNYMVAFGCICFAVAGYLIHMNIARMVYDKHNLEMEKTNQKLWQEMDDFDKARLEFTAKYPTREESRKELMRRFADYETTTINRARS